MSSGPGVSEAWLRYRTDPVRFVQHALGVEPDPWQAEALRALATKHRVAIRSGHGPGKTATLSWAVLWGLLVTGSLVPCTAPTQETLRSNLWPEIKRWTQRNPLIEAQLEFSEQRIRLRHCPTVFAVARVARTHEGLAGFHARQLLYVIDEASGVPDESMAVVEGALTTNGARALLAGNPTRPTGYFVDAFARNADNWHQISVNCENTPRVSADWVRSMRETWGADSDVYRVRVLGLPPQSEAKGFIAHTLVEQAENRTLDPDGPLIIGVDPARYGTDKTALVARRGAKVVAIHARHGLSNPQAAAWTAEISEQLAQPDEKPAIRVDDAGVGGGVTDLLQLMVQEKTLTATVQGLTFGGKGDRHYATNAGVWWGRLRQLMQEGRLDLPTDPELHQQLTTRTFATNLNGKIVLEPKDHMSGRGIPSPDKADALALAYAPAPNEGLLDYYREQRQPHPETATTQRAR